MFWPIQGSLETSFSVTLDSYYLCRASLEYSFNMNRYLVRQDIDPENLTLSSSLKIAQKILLLFDSPVSFGPLIFLLNPHGFLRLFQLAM